MKIILIGSSTGGPKQLKFLLKDMELKDTCVVIAQHMSVNFISSFVNQFNKEALAEVVMANDKEVLQNGKIYICQQNTILSGALNIFLNFSEECTNFKPNVDLLFKSAQDLSKTNKIIAVLLTGMGDDGAKGLFDLYQVGVKCLCENEKDSIVYGMPKKAKQLNPELKQMSLLEIKNELIKFVRNDTE